jgi:predicted ribonuclease YlaK
MTTLKKVWALIIRHKGIALSILLIVIIGGYSFLSWQLWKNYQSSYETAYIQLHADIDHALALPSASDEEKVQKTSALHGVSHLSNDVCHVPFLIQWQTIIEKLRDHQEHCKQLAMKSQEVKSRLVALAEYLDSERSLLALLVSIDTPSKMEADAFEAQAKEWQDISTKVMDLHVQPDFEPVRDKADESSAKISSAWQKLHETTVAEDRGAYEDARAKLSEAYDTLAAIDPASKKQFQSLTQALQSAYDALFS